jgi:hypothetical protein
LNGVGQVIHPAGLIATEELWLNIIGRKGSIDLNIGSDKEYWEEVNMTEVNTNVLQLLTTNDCISFKPNPKLELYSSGFYQAGMFTVDSIELRPNHPDFDKRLVACVNAHFKTDARFK